MNLKEQIQKILWITLAWTLVSIYQFFLGWGSVLEVATSEIKYEIWILFRGSLLTGIIAGLVGGTVLTLVWEKWLRTKPYGWTIRSILISYLIVFIIVSIPTSVYFNITYLETNIFDSRLWAAVLRAHLNPTILIPFIFWLTVVLGTMIVFLVNDKYGPGVFSKFLMGKYFHPSREERIFMFLDLRSSTSIAERLGEERYFEFLRMVVKIATEGILKHHGEIYQYVGDEIVISWPVERGVAHMNCINCFFDIQKALRVQSDYFQRTFGVLPEFKAGLHYGNVMAGEIGVVKRDIAYSGDVLNTTARIQSKCNEMGVDLLLSKNLIDRLDTLANDFRTEELGTIALRGKKEKMQLCTLVSDR
ncbi:MAG: adenylate/guanylate cyclase domain-containing protein [Cyclobacteriaceae bacterium]